jgi:hypothetical protein
MTDFDLVYLSGAPGAGKSTLMAELTKGCFRVALAEPIPHDTLSYGWQGPRLGVELGRRRETFSGTDALAMSIHPRACQWIATRPQTLVLAEGDRLATLGFLNAAVDAGYRVTLVHLSATLETLDARCAQRGSKQNPTWRKGRITKANRLIDTVGGWDRLSLNAETRSAEGLAEDLRTYIPALHALPTRSPDMV